MPEITGTVQDETQNLYVGLVQFENLDAPCAAGGRVTGLATTDVLTGDDGSLPDGFHLAPGRTRLIVAGRRSRTFNIPEGNGVYDLAALMLTSTRVTRTVVLADTIADLREYPSDSTNFKAEVIADANNAFAVFKWDAGATNADDGNQYVRPNDFEAAGLWVRIL